MPIFSLNDKSPQIDSSAFIADTAVIIGTVIIDPNASVWFNSILRADKGSIKVGENSVIEDNCVIHGMGNTNIGNNVMIGHNTVIHSSTVGNNALIGANCVLMDGVKIGEGTMIEMKSQIQPHVEIPPNLYVRGVPSKRAKKQYKVIRENKQEILDRNLKHVHAYGKLAKFYKKSLQEKI